MSVTGFFRIARPVNSVVAGCAAIVAHLIASGTVIPATILLFVVVMLITAAGNVINDYFDATIDTVNRPERPIPAGDMGRGAARGFATTLFLAGVLVSLFTVPLCIVIAVFNSVLLIAYAARLKSTPLFGNLAVSYLSASIFLFGGAFAGWSGLIRTLPIAAITFLAMATRELLKDAEDVEGDAAGGAKTLPMQIGIKNASRLALAFAVLAVCASLIPAFWWGVWYLAGIGIVDLIIIAGAIRALPCTSAPCIKASHATTMVKAGMFASLVVFTLAALLL